MLRGLELLSAEELKEVARLIELDPQTPTEEIRTGVLAWMCQQVKLKSSSDPGHLERAVLEWVARAWAVPFDASLDTDNLERLLRRHIASDATEVLAPCWRIACALIVAESSAVDQSKFEMLEKAARLAVPSTSVLSEYRQEWERLTHEWAGEDPRPLLEQDLATLATTPELGKKALQLGLVIGLADGRLSADEERLCRDLGVAMGIAEAEAVAIATELNQVFWKHRNTMFEECDTAQEMALVAAQKALAESGALEGLANEARDQMLTEGDEQGKGSPGWSRLLGALSGLSQFFSTRMDEEDQARLARIVYLTIKTQRAEIEQMQAREEAARRRAAAPVPAAPKAPAPPAPPAVPAPSGAGLPVPGLTGSMAKQQPEQKRSIKLDL